ncbi:putative ATP-binding cassette protein [Thermochaetoides thermophila DSM 1495]|uniref:Putative ATP-binding cassette protein n=1 Tax=Chaetomium thermophilum (strain DSM 1495 / CBS 144.50 / IMI 039719) TaxID=759272 RepID=G0SGW3_CHATD|nr:putative ATP-binding cassette protein [Thermochaetoides thermophila DSM 1495]EGS17452.1 putative ATP-binding cassette protein [Thermochaetoides thermophila DSM 1495]
MIPGAAAAAVRRAALLPQLEHALASATNPALGSPSSLSLGFASTISPITPARIALPIPISKPTAIRPFCSQTGARDAPTTRSAISATGSMPLRTSQWLGLTTTSSVATTMARWTSPMTILRQLSTSRSTLQENKSKTEEDTTTVTSTSPSNTTQTPAYNHTQGFQLSEKAAKAAHVNMRARLSKEGKGQGRDGKPGMAEIWRLLKIARPELKWLSAAFVLLLISSAVTMSIPFSVGRILDLSTKGEMDEVRLLGLTMRQFFIGLGMLLTLGACANFGRIVLLRMVGERVVARLRTQLYRRTYIQDAEFFDANRVGDLISRLGSDTIIVGKSVTQNISDGLRALVSGAAGFVMMAWLSPKLTSLIFVMAPPIALGAFFFGRAMRSLSRQLQKNVGTLTKIGEERLGNIKTSQAFAGEIQELRRYSNQVRKIFALGRREAIISGTFFASTSWAGNMTILAMLIVGGNLVRSGTMTLGDLTSFMMYTAFAGSSLFGLSGFYSELMKGVGAASRLFELQDRKPIIPSTVGIKVASAQGPIRFENVHFSYPTRPAVSIFNGLTFEIPSGSNVCIVGPSGGGKSTVASLLLRFYSPTSGRITINGVDISTMNVKSLRRRIGVVAQEPVLFSGTIAENIAYGKPDATRAEIVAAARKANCGFISDFPDGLETQVGARGAQLSGGQKQRIAIARALLKDPDILILDEATSALDAESETLVNSALAELFKGRSTTISIAHRLSTIKRSDRIIVLSSEGTVAEVGTYAELSANKESAFSKLMEWQMSGGEVPAECRTPSAGPRIMESEEIEEELVEEEEEEGEGGRRERA